MHRFEKLIKFIILEVQSLLKWEKNDWNICIYFSNFFLIGPYYALVFQPPQWSMNVSVCSEISKQRWLLIIRWSCWGKIVTISYWFLSKGIFQLIDTSIIFNVKFNWLDFARVETKCSIFEHEQSGRKKRLSVFNRASYCLLKGFLIIRYSKKVGSGNLILVKNSSHIVPIY